MSDPKEKFKSLVAGFDVAMFVMSGADELIRARPMRIVKTDDDGGMWFISSKSGWAADLADDASVAVTMQNGQRFVSISGMATLAEDRETLRTLWSEAMRPWFPQGIDSNDIVAVRFVAYEAEYWDSTGMNRLRYLFDAVKAVARGRRIEDRDEREHGSVTL